jgi:hypothetical protein
MFCRVIQVPIQRRCLLLIKRMLTECTSLPYPYLWFKSRARSRSQWPRGLRRVLSSIALTLGSWVRIPLGAWMRVSVFLCCGVLCRWRTFVGLILRSRSCTKCPNRSISSEVNILNRNRPWMAYTLKDGDDDHDDHDHMPGIQAT